MCKIRRTWRLVAVVCLAVFILAGCERNDDLITEIGTITVDYDAPINESIDRAPYSYVNVHMYDRNMFPKEGSGRTDLKIFAVSFAGDIGLSRRASFTYIDERRLSGLGMRAITLQELIPVAQLLRRIGQYKNRCLVAIGSRHCFFGDIEAEVAPCIIADKASYRLDLYGIGRDPNALYLAVRKN